MQDAVSLIGKLITIDGQLLTVKALYFIPGTNRIYVGMATASHTYINYPINELIPYFKEQIKL
tara:strand:- start:25305 stop:25493 length:189 start_codon:yes stop_codon:yes gene_type:complete